MAGLLLFGAVFGMAAGSTLLTATGSFQAVFLATSGVMFVVLLFGWFAVER